MKRLSLLLLVMIFLFSSCKSDFFGRAGQLTSLMNEEAEKIQSMSVEIIRCFTEKDKEGMKKLFCEKSKASEALDKQIDAAFERFLCEVYTTADIDTSAGGGESYDHGERTSWDVSPEIPYIEVLCDADSDPETDLQRRYYSIDYYWHITNKNDTSLEGLQYIHLQLLNDDGDGISIGEYIG